MTPPNPRHDKHPLGYPRSEPGPFRTPSLGVILLIGAGLVILGYLYTAGRHSDPAIAQPDSASAIGRPDMAKIAEAARVASLAADERVAMAKTLIGGTVTFQQAFPFCVTGTGANCQRVTYTFYVKAKIRDIDPQKRIAQVQISEATSLGNEKGAPGPLFSQGRVAATEAYKARFIGATQAKTLEEVGLAF